MSASNKRSQLSDDEPASSLNRLTKPAKLHLPKRRKVQSSIPPKLEKRKEVISLLSSDEEEGEGENNVEQNAKENEQPANINPLRRPSTTEQPSKQLPVFISLDDSDDDNDHNNDTTDATREEITKEQEKDDNANMNEEESDQLVSESEHTSEDGNAYIHQSNPISKDSICLVDKDSTKSMSSDTTRKLPSSSLPPMMQQSQSRPTPESNSEPKRSTSRQQEDSDDDSEPLPKSQLQPKAQPQVEVQSKTQPQVQSESEQEDGSQHELEQELHNEPESQHEQEAEQQHPQTEPEVETQTEKQDNLDTTPQSNMEGTTSEIDDQGIIETTPGLDVDNSNDTISTASHELSSTIPRTSLSPSRGTHRLRNVVISSKKLLLRLPKNKNKKTSSLASIGSKRSVSDANLTDEETGDSAIHHQASPSVPDTTTAPQEEDDITKEDDTSNKLDSATDFNEMDLNTTTLDEKETLPQVDANPISEDTNNASNIPSSPSLNIGCVIEKETGPLIEKEEESETHGSPTNDIESDDDDLPSTDNISVDDDDLDGGSDGESVDTEVLFESSLSNDIPHNKNTRNSGMNTDVQHISTSSEYDTAEEDYTSDAPVTDLDSVNQDDIQDLEESDLPINPADSASTSQIIEDKDMGSKSNIPEVLHSFIIGTGDISASTSVASEDDIVEEPTHTPAKRSSIIPVKPEAHVDNSQTENEGKIDQQPRRIQRRLQKTGYTYDVAMSYHTTPDPLDIHPEDPRRIFRIYNILRENGLLSECKRINSRKATKREILLVHNILHYRTMRSTSDYTKRKDYQQLERNYDSIYLNSSSFDSGLYSVGCLIELVEAVILNQIKNGFAIIRPPGHHAEADVPMGFCLFNNVAIATKHALQNLNVKKVLILDWDVHFGNGTQAIFADNPNVLYMSLHRYENAGFYPSDKKGSAVYAGHGRGRGKTVNVPWSCAGMTDADYLYAFRQVIIPIATEFNPDLVIVSAGFDAAINDPIGLCKVTPAGYGQMTHALKSLACGKLVIALEGGYDLNSIAVSALACMEVLLGESPDPINATLQPREECLEVIQDVKRVQSQYWNCF